ncbi:MAG: hypothetical protein Q8910_13580 [Bacteroidota bacterium]|nr:hypothetical protein [Bacteroidota bacterium]
MKLLLILAVSFLCVNQLFAQVKSPKVYYVSFKTSDPVTGNPLRQFPQDTAFVPGKEKITVFPQIRFQTISGIGGCFNENGGEALLSLPKAKQQEILRNLFDEKEGCGFNFCRTAVGASDFGLDAYSFSEKPYDYNMQYFSISRDEKYLLPYIKGALAANPGIRFFASPWSPPAWMKESGKMTGNVKNSSLKDSLKIYQAYARYFVKYIQSYVAQGVRIERLNPQNETDMNPTYPGCIMEPWQMKKLVLDYLIPEFKKSKITTEIWPGTYRVYRKFEAMELFADATLRKSVPGIGIQYTKPLHINNFRSAFPEVKMMHTEGKCFNGDNSLKQAQSRWAEITDYLCNGVENYAYWNMILNETGKSGWDWKQNALINIDRKTGAVTYNPDYAVMYLVSKFIRPGDVRMAHYSSTDAPCLVVRNAKNQYKVILQNDSEADKVVSLQIGENESFKVKIPALSLSVVVTE